MQLVLGLLGIALALFGLWRSFQVLRILKEVTASQREALLPLVLTAQILGLSLLCIWLLLLAAFLLKA